MKRAGPPALVALVLLVGYAGCGADRPPLDGSAGGPSALDGAPGARIRLDDDAGREIVLKGDPRRILSLVPSATDVLVALGQIDRLVGRTDFDAGTELNHLPSVGGGLNPAIERVVALRPDMVVHFRAESDPETPRQLEAAGIPHVAIRPDRIDDIRRIVALLGAMVREGERADSLRAAMDRDLAAVSARVEDAPRPRVVLLGGDPPTVAGPRTFLHELLVVAGGENAFSDVEELYAPISLEEILVRDVDVIVAPEATRVPPALAAIPLRRIPLDVLTPGLQVARSARTLAEILHPERFP